MLQYASSVHIPLIRSLWQETFGDSDAFLDAYFDKIFKPEQCMLALENDELCAALQVLPYTYQKGEEQISTAYIFAVMTAPSKRKKGYMTQLFEFAFVELKSKQIPLVFLIPQESYLFDVYAKFGFKPTFAIQNVIVSLPTINVEFITPSINDAYLFYSEFYKSKNIISQSPSQFSFVCEILQQEGGSLIATHINNQITALCLAIPNHDEVRVLDFMADSEAASQHLKAAIYTKYGLPTAQISLCSNNSPTPQAIGMALILDETRISYSDLDTTYFSLMMNV